jgi:hypothetical protein
VKKPETLILILVLVDIPGKLWGMYNQKVLKKSKRADIWINIIKKFEHIHEEIMNFQVVQIKKSVKTIILD